MTVVYESPNYTPDPEAPKTYRVWVWSNKYQIWHPKEQYDVLVTAQNNADYYARTYKTVAEVRIND